jgi:hypothetical protein
LTGEITVCTTEAMNHIPPVVCYVDTVFSVSGMTDQSTGRYLWINISS